MTTPAGARAARQLVRDCQHRDEWICCWTCATAALARAAQGAQPVGALIHEIAIAAADRFVVLHCRPDHITLTHGALLNLSYTIKDAIRQYLARAGDEGTQPPDDEGAAEALRMALTSRFTSTNSVPVERAYIRVDEWPIVEAALARAAQGAPGVERPRSTSWEDAERIISELWAEIARLRG